MTVNEQLYASIEDARRLLGGVCRQTVYNLLNDGAIESVKIGKRRMIVVASLARLAEKSGRAA